MIEGIPLPDRNGPFEEGFWTALERGELAHQHCKACGAWHFPARWRCTCKGQLEYSAVSGVAKLWSWTHVHAPVLPAFAPFTPYVVGIAQLVESPSLRMVGPLLRTQSDTINAVHPDELHIGMPLRAAVINLAPDTAWPAWLIA